MHEPADFHILTECGNGYISECPCCHQFNFAYKNLLLSFPEEEMVRFLLWLLDYRYMEENYLPLPHARDRVYCSPVPNLYLAFSLDELEEIKDLLAEVQLLLEARKILS